MTVSTASKTEAMFQDSDPALHANKQIVLRFLKELMQAGHWEKSAEILTDRYIQHNPLAESGPEAVKAFFTETLGLPRLDEVVPLDIPVTAVVAQGDFVIIMMPCRNPHPDKPGEFYESTWFDAWRIVDGKLDEHWDGMRLVAGKSAKELALESFSPADEG